ncbi:MAG: hypothetical protein RSB08_02895, partial [Clostridia bacterium]
TALVKERIMKSVPEKDYKPEDVFYGPLPVSEPQPILRPTKKIQLQSTVHPVAITPYITYEGDGQDNGNPKTKSEVVDDKAVAAVPKKGGARIAGLCMLLLSMVALCPFVLSMISPFPISSLQKYIEVINLPSEIQKIISAKSFAKIGANLTVYLISIGLLAGVVNILKSLYALISGKRKGYIFFAIITLVCFSVAAISEYGFGNMSNIGGLFKNWTSITYLASGLLNFIFALVISLICRKQPKFDVVEF